MEWKKFDVLTEIFEKQRFAQHLTDKKASKNDVAI